MRAFIAFFKKELRGLVMLACLSFAAAPAVHASDGVWAFIEPVAGSPAAAGYRSSDVTGFLSYLQQERRWRFRLSLEDGPPHLSKVAIHAIYEADPARIRPYRVEGLELSVERAAGAAPHVEMTIPRTFIVHFQGADRLEISAGSHHLTLNMSGSAKAIARIYAALGEAHGGEGKRISELLAGPSVSEEPPRTAQQTPVTPKEPANKPRTVPDCDLTPDSDLDEYGACLDGHIDDIEAAFAETGDAQSREQLQTLMIDSVGQHMGNYIRQKYPRMPELELCDEYTFSAGVERNSPVRIQALTDTIDCLVAERDSRRDSISLQFDEAIAVMRMDYLGQKGKDRLDQVYDREMDSFEEYRRKLEAMLKETRGALSWAQGN